MATTVYAQRVQELKLRINKKDPSFQTVYNAFDELCGCKRLSRHNIIWARKKLIEFRDHWTDEDAKRLLDKLALRVEHAAAKWQKRDNERVAAKAAAAANGRGRPRKDGQLKQRTIPTPAPVAPASSPMELWKQMLKDQENRS